MESEEQKQSIKVVDKRRFSEDGEPGSSEGSEASKPSESPILDSQGSTQPASDSPPNPADQEPVTLDFSSFIMGLATQALIMLGEVPDPNTNLVSINAEAARQTIDALAILEEKTRGNLSESEAKLMTEVVAGLRMTYVEKMRQAPVGS